MEAIICRQQGFVSITHSANLEADGCKLICLIFEDETALNHWAAQPDHDALIDALDDYRSRNDWEAVLTKDEQADLSSLDWTTYPAKT